MTTTAPSNGHGGRRLDRATIDYRADIADAFFDRCLELAKRCRGQEPGIKPVAQHFFISGTRAVRQLHNANAADPVLLSLMVEALVELRRAIDDALDEAQP